MSKQQLITTLRDYFTSKGKFLTMEEYKEAEDAPYRFQIVKRTVGTWARLKGIMGEIQPLPEKPAAPVKPVVVKKKDV